MIPPLFPRGSASRAVALVPLAVLPAVVPLVLVGQTLRVAFSRSAGAGNGAELILSRLAARTGWLAMGLGASAAVLTILLVFVALGFRDDSGEAGRFTMRATLVGGAALQVVALAGLLAHAEDRVVRLATLTLETAGSETEAARWRAEMERLAPGAGSRNRAGAEIASRALTRGVLVVELGGIGLGAYCLALTGMSLVLAWRVPDRHATTAASLVIVLAAAVGAGVLADRARNRGRWLNDRIREARARPAPAPMAVPSAAASSGPSRDEACASGSADQCLQAGRGTSDAERLRLYERACDRGTAEMCAHLAMLHMNGIGTPVDEVKARRLLQRACVGGDRDSCGLFEKLKSTH